MFNRKIKKETNEEFREIFTYSNFKRTMVENEETKAKIQEIEAENQEMKTKIGQLLQRVEGLERFTGHSDEKLKNE